MLLVAHALWLPAYIFWAERKELLLWAVCQGVLACMIWDDFLGLLIGLPLTILLSALLLAYRAWQTLQ
jgi:hypothetical protein